MKLKWLLLFSFSFLMAQNKVNLDKEIDLIFQSYKGNVPGAALMVIYKGKPLIIKTYGLADIEKKLPVKPNTNFRLASITKQFTAMAIMILCDKGLLKLESTLKEVFPEFPDYGKKITIRHLLQHTSGLIDYEDLIPDTATEQVLDKDVLRMMIQQDSTYFEPGSQFRYSNSGYAVLAMVVEKISGTSFPEFLKTNIFEPLGMKNTLVYQKSVNSIPNRAYGYNILDDRILFSDQSLTSAVMGDGGIYSSIEDLCKWDKALNKGMLLKKKSFEEIFKPGLEGYGLGWYIDEFEGEKRIYHTGSTCGFRNVYMRFPDKELSIIILTNRREPDVKPMAEKIYLVFLEYLRSRGN